MQVCHVGIQVGFPLGVEGVRIDPGTDVVQFHLGCIPDIDAVDLDGSEQEHEGQEHVDGQDDENSEKRKVPALIPDDFFVHRLILYFQ